MVNLRAGLITCCAIAMGAAVADHGSLTESQVRALYAGVAGALNRGDVEFVLERIADDASLETRTRHNERISVEPFSKEDYRASMRQLYRGVSSYHCSLKIERMHLAANHHRAEVLYTMTERWRDDGGWQVTVTKGQTRLISHSGRLQATEFILWITSPRGVI